MTDFNNKYERELWEKNMQDLAHSELTYMKHEELVEFLNKYTSKNEEPKIYEYGAYKDVAVEKYKNCALLHNRVINAYVGFTWDKIDQAFDIARDFKIRYNSINSALQ